MKKISIILMFIASNLFGQDKYESAHHRDGFGIVAFCLRDQNNSAIASDKVEVTINDSISVWLATNKDGENRNSLRLKAGKYKITFGVIGYQPLVTRTIETKDAKTTFIDCITLTTEK
jgi:hypothetical protein